MGLKIFPFKKYDKIYHNKQNADLIKNFEYSTDDGKLCCLYLNEYDDSESAFFKSMAEVTIYKNYRLFEIFDNRFEPLLKEMKRLSDCKCYTRNQNKILNEVVKPLLLKNEFEK